MIDRRTLFLLPLCGVLLPAAAPAEARLAQAVAFCWQARGVRFTAAQVAARIGDRQGKAALLALAGAVQDADGDDQETAVEIVWEAGGPPSPAEPLLARDLTSGLPAVLLDRDGQWWLLQARDGERLKVRHPISAETRVLAVQDAVLIGRPVIAGA